jgi:quercetin dioxygenase-like cupin family protein
MVDQLGGKNVQSTIKIVSSGNDLQPVQMPGSANCKIQELLTEKNGAPNFAMRFFEIEPKGHTPQHSHPWEHEIYVLEGEGELRSKETIQFKSSDALLVPANTLHQFYNSGSKPLKFLCLIPNTANYQPKSN